jgi:hypothetical protein
MIGAGVDQVCKPKLSHTAQPLDLWGTQAIKLEVRHLHISVQRIANYPWKGQKASPSVYTLGNWAFLNSRYLR